MIRFSAFLVVVAVGLLVAGVVTSKLLLVYIAIGVSGVALLALGVGAAVNWRELTGEPKTAAADTSAQGLAPEGPVPAPQPQAPAPQVPAQAPQVFPALAASQQKPSAPAAAGAASAGASWPAAAPSGPSRAGYLPTEQPPRSQPSWASPSPFQPPSAQPAARSAQAQPTQAQAQPGPGSAGPGSARRGAASPGRLHGAPPGTRAPHAAVAAHSAIRG